MKATPTRLPGVLLIESPVHVDERGFFTETFNRRDFAAATGSDVLFVQDNLSSSVAGVLRGLHYQLPPHAQGKLVRVVAGSVFDVAVDIRRASPHFGKWVGLELSASNALAIWIPPGFAHGFVALQDDTIFQYKTSDYYDKACERAIVWNDADLAIAWPQGIAPRVSPRDEAAPRFAGAEVFP